jgi:hypothetical protein
MVKEYNVSKFTFLFGASWNIFGVGVSLGRWGFDLSLGFFWMTIEW